MSAALGTLIYVLFAAGVCRGMWDVLDERTRRELRVWAWGRLELASHCLWLLTRHPAALRWRIHAQGMAWWYGGGPQEN